MSSDTILVVIALALLIPGLFVAILFIIMGKL